MRVKIDRFKLLPKGFKKKGEVSKNARKRDREKAETKKKEE